MDENKLFALADALTSLRQERDDLEQRLSEVNAKINQVDYKLCEFMTENKTQNFTRDGKQFYLTNKTRASALSEFKEDLYAALREHGYGDLITETVNGNSFNAFVTEQIDQNDDQLPKWLDGLVSVFEKTTVVVRKATNKTK